MVRKGTKKRTSAVHSATRRKRHSPGVVVASCSCERAHNAQAERRFTETLLASRYFADHWTVSRSPAKGHAGRLYSTIIQLKKPWQGKRVKEQRNRVSRAVLQTRSNRPSLNTPHSQRTTLHIRRFSRRLPTVHCSKVRVRVTSTKHKPLSFSSPRLMCRSRLRRASRAGFTRTMRHCTITSDVLARDSQNGAIVVVIRGPPSSLFFSCRRYLARCC